MKDIPYPEEIKQEYWEYLLRKMEREKKGGEGDGLNGILFDGII